MKVQGYFFRMYGMPGCAHCLRTETLFQSYGIPLQVIHVDRILEQAMIKTFHMQQFQGPVLMNYMIDQACLGENVPVYEQWIRLYLEVHGKPIPLNGDKGQQDLITNERETNGIFSKK